MKQAIWIAVVVLLIVHQDVWFWGDTRLVLGFMPVTLLYHMGISLASAIVFFLATKYAWPAALSAENESAEGRET